MTLGKVSGAWGVRGWVKVHSYTADRDAILDYRPWYLVGPDGERKIFVCAARSLRSGLIVRFGDIETREQVVPLVGRTICVDSDQLPALNDGEYYWNQLVGLQVTTREGRNLGTVARLLETGANDVLVVCGDRERLIPYVPGTVLEISLATQTITVDWDPEF